MRKISIFLSMLLLAAMLLTACAAEETDTPVAGTEAPPMTDEPTATEVPLGTETVMPEDGTTTPGIPVTGEEDPSRVANQLDYDVWNGEGDQIGEVNDIILDLDNTRISYVIVGTGGFLEIGEKDVLVPWDSLDIQVSGDDATAETAFIYTGDQEQFDNAPDVDVNAILPGRGEPAADWDAEIRAFWESGVLPATESPEATEAPEMTETVAPEATAMPEATEVTGTMELQGIVLASEFLGSPVTSIPGEDVDAGEVDITATPATGDDTATATVNPGAATVEPVLDGFDGNVDDVIVDVDSGEILYIVVTANFDEGQRWIPIPLRLFQWNADNASYVLNIDPVELQDAPFFEDGQYPVTSEEGWDDEFNAFWENF